MPQVFSSSGFSFYVYFDDHSPPHVHIFKSGEVIINLKGRPEIRENRGMGRKDQKQALRLTAELQDFLLRKWSEING